MKNKQEYKIPQPEIQYVCRHSDKMDFVCKNCISSIRQNDVDELIEWVEKERKIWKTWDDSPTPGHDRLRRITRDEALSDIITYLKRIKEKI